MEQQFAIIGTGNVGSALQEGLTRAGYEVRPAKRGQVGAAASWADVIVLGIPYSALRDVARELKAVAKRKTVVDVTNALTAEFQLAVGFTTSGAESCRKCFPRCTP
jgi:8-hydroxy-5-deazaflavin:NADPH oxidoreductase